MPEPDRSAYVNTLNQGVQLRIQAKVLEEEAKAMKEHANELFEVALTISGEKRLVHERGTVTRKTTPRSTLDKVKLAGILVDKGVQVDVVKASMEEATTVKESVSIEFRETKAKVENSG